MTRLTRSPSLSLLVTAAWFGLLTSLVEILALAQCYFLPLPRQVGRERFILLSRDLVWMGPLADVLLFGAVGAVLAGLYRWRPRDGSVRLALAVYGALALFSVLCLHTLPRLSMLSKLVLAAGFGMQLSLAIRSRREKFHRLVNRSLPWMAAVIVLLTIGVRGWEAWREHGALAKLPPAGTGRPNVLLIVLDTVRAQSLSLYGHTRRTTPQLDRFAERAVVFDRAYSTAPWTLPSIASMFTGQLPRDTSADWWVPLDDTHPTLAEILASEGYLTAGFVANMVFGNEELGLGRGFAHYATFLISPGQVVLSASLGRYFGCWLSEHTGCGLRKILNYYDTLGRKSASEVNDQFLSWLAARESERPFFAFLNYFDAHHPYVPPKPFDTMFGPLGPRNNPGELRDNYGPEEAAAERDAYEGSVANLDDRIGALLDRLDRQGVLQNTLVIITADHGESFLEHGVMHHGYSLYATELHVPLLISWPSRLPAGVRVTTPVSLRNLPATVLELIGSNQRQRAPGFSLSALWSSVANAAPVDPAAILSETSARLDDPPFHPASRGDMSSLVIGSFHYIRNGDGVEELYDVEKDPWEKTDLAKGASVDLLNQFRSRLTAPISQ